MIGQNPPHRPVRWGVISTSQTAVRKAIPALRSCAEAELRAIASRDPTRAAKVASDLGIPVVHQTYDALLADAETDAVYVALPNSLHREYTERAARAGKHVLCEKPAATTGADADAMLACCARAGVTFMEGLMYRFLPQAIALREQVHGGAVGEIRRLHLSMSFTLEPHHSRIRLHRDTQGGALADVGVYPIDCALWLMGRLPERVYCSGHARDRAEVETGFAAVLTFADGVEALLDGGFDRARQSRGEVVGTRGVVSVDPLFMPGVAQLRMLPTLGKPSEQSFPETDPFKAEFAYFSRCLLTGASPAIEPAHTRSTARVLEALRASWVCGAPITPAPMTWPAPGTGVAPVQPEEGR
jgi:xylose dehydrogenase (NAD/NADP)